MSTKSETTLTYDKSARMLADYFTGIGSRSADIDLAFSLAPTQSNPSVLEIGCGDGRDAIEIIKHTNKYIGMDISKGMLEIAQEKLPDTIFHRADIAEYIFPKNIDIIFSFASLLHSDIHEVEAILGRVYEALNPGGVFYISLKHMPEYCTKIKEDKYGSRIFYFYNPSIIQKLAGDQYETIFLDAQTIGDTDWFSVVLAKSL
jgi:SAM-dependent methyltransferase